MARERMWYVGDGIRAPENAELVGTPVNIKGKTGKVVENDAFYITVEWNAPDTAPRKKMVSFSQLLRFLVGKPIDV